MKEIKTKEDVFKAICNASRLGNLGFFVGSGFTKAILENNTYYEAYTWAELLKVCCEEMKINENILKNKNSYPEIATKICKEYSIENNITYQEAVRKMKCIISEKQMFIQKRVSKRIMKNTSEIFQHPGLPLLTMIQF